MRRPTVGDETCSRARARRSNEATRRMRIGCLLGVAAIVPSVCWLFAGVARADGVSDAASAAPKLFGGISALSDANAWCVPPRRSQRAVAAFTTAPIPVDEIEPNDSPAAAQVIPLGDGPGLSRSVNILANFSVAGDVDFFRFSAIKGDVIGMAALAVANPDTRLAVTDLSGSAILTNDDHGYIAFLYPPASPFPGGDAPLDSALSWIVPAAGDYLVRVESVNSFAGNYSVKIRSARPGFESKSVPQTQIIFLDFDGATVDAASLFGFGASVASLSPLSAFLDGWGLTLADEAAVIDAILSVVQENFDDLRQAPLNGNRDVDLIDGHFDIEWRNSRDDPDPFAVDDVTRVIIGGTIGELGISTIGIAQYLDPGNFSSRDTAVVLLDTLSAPATNANSINNITRDAGFSMIDAVGRLVGNVATHEIGHCVGDWHTDGDNGLPSIMDSGIDPIRNISGAGPDGVLGTVDDVDVDFTTDDSSPFEPIATGQERVDVRTAFAFATGTGPPVETKFSQPPAQNQQQMVSIVDLSDQMPDAATVDDFIADGRPITAVRWWGSAITPPPRLCAISNAGFESGALSPWIAVDNGLAQSLPWTVGPAGGGAFANSAPVSGSWDAFNGFDGVAGLEYQLYQDVLLDAAATTITLTTNHRIQFNSLGIPSMLPRVFEISIRDTAGNVLSLLHREEVFLDGKPYTDLGWRNLVFDLSAFAGQTVRIHFLEIIPETATGRATIEFDDIGISCDGVTTSLLSGPTVRPEASRVDNERRRSVSHTSPSANRHSLRQRYDARAELMQTQHMRGNAAARASAQSSSIDGWFIGFHERLSTSDPAQPPLGLYYCRPNIVDTFPTSLVACDDQDVLDHRVTLANCCLVHAGVDSRTGLTPATATAFNEEVCLAYDLDIHAVVGRAFLPSETSASLVGRWNAYVGDYSDVWADGNVAYVPNWTRADGSAPRVHVLDISDAANPTLLSTIFIPAPNNGASPQDVKVADGLLFIALDGDGNDGVAIVDVRVPQTPILLTTIRIPGFEDTHNLFVDSGFLYVVNAATPRIGVVDLTNYNPDSPPPTIASAKWILENVGTSFVHDITVHNGRLYAAAWDSGMWVFDVSNVAVNPPAFLGKTIGVATHSVWPTGDGKYVVIGREQSGGGIEVHEIVNSGGSITLVLRDAFTLDSQAFSTHNQVVVGNRLYVSWYQAGLQVFDIDPASGRLQLIRTFDTSSYSNNGVFEGNWGVYPFLGDDRILLTDMTQGFFIVDTTTLVDQCVEVVTTSQTDAATWGWYAGLNDSANRPALAGPVTKTPLGEWRDGPWTTVISGCGESNAAFELLTTTPDIGTTCICTRDDDCDDNDACTQDVCSAACLNTPRVYGDVDANSVVNIFDLFCVLDGFAGEFASCSFVNIDIEPCSGNSTLDVFDLFAVLDAFGGGDPCNCPLAR